MCIESTGSQTRRNAHRCFITRIGSNTFRFGIFQYCPLGAVSSYVRVFKIEDGASIKNEQVQTAKRLVAEDAPIYYSRRESTDAI